LLPHQASGSLNGLTNAWLRLSQKPSTRNGGTCYGDLGGPNFLGGSDSDLLVATTITGDTAYLSPAATSPCSSHHGRHYGRRGRRPRAYDRRAWSSSLIWVLRLWRSERGLRNPGLTPRYLRRISGAGHEHVLDKGIAHTDIKSRTA
jgi:hypothetical protein